MDVNDRPGFRPNPRKTEDPAGEFPFTAVVELEPSGKGTKYSAMVIHGDEASARKHDAMGFHEGWGKALDQLVEYVKSS